MSELNSSFMQWFTLYASPLGIDLGSASLIYELAVKEYKEDKEESDQKYQALVTVHNVFCTAIRKAIGMECEMPVKDIVDTVVAVARNHRTLYEENAVLCKTLDRLLAASLVTDRRAREGNSVPSDFLPARSTSEFNLRGIKNCPICGTEIVATPNGIQPKNPNPAYAKASFEDTSTKSFPFQKPKFDPNFMDIPPEIMNAAHQIANWAAINGLRDWEIGPVSDRNLVSKLRDSPLTPKGVQVVTEFLESLPAKIEGAGMNECTCGSISSELSGCDYCDAFTKLYREIEKFVEELHSTDAGPDLDDNLP